MVFVFTQIKISNTKDLGTLEMARLMAIGKMVSADALIGCFDARYHYFFWRPQFAIPHGDTDGNANTEADPSFVPLISMPPDPEYPSAHGCATSSQTEVFAAFLGTQQIEVDIPCTVCIATRHYTTANDRTKEIIIVRVWGGIHYRELDVTGANLGRKVAHWTLKSYFLPEN